MKQYYITHKLQNFKTQYDLAITLPEIEGCITKWLSVRNYWDEDKEFVEFYSKSPLIYNFVITKSLSDIQKIDIFSALNEITFETFKSLTFNLCFKYFV